LLGIVMFEGTLLPSLRHEVSTTREMRSGVGSVTTL